MTNTIPDLWPPAVFTPAVATPIAILRRQGEALGEHTQNFVFGEVVTLPETHSADQVMGFNHFFKLVAPLIRYEQALLKVAHKLQPYPATLVETGIPKPANQQDWSKRVNNEQELQDALREFFAQPRVIEIVQAVINLSNDVAPAESV